MPVLGPLLRWLLLAVQGEHVLVVLVIDHLEITNKAVDLIEVQPVAAVLGDASVVGDIQQSLPTLAPPAAHLEVVFISSAIQRFYLQEGVLVTKALLRFNVDEKDIVKGSSDPPLQSLGLARNGGL